MENLSNIVGPFQESVGVSEFSQTPFKHIKLLSGMLKMGAADGVENKDILQVFLLKRVTQLSS